MLTARESAIVGHAVAAANDLLADRGWPLWRRRLTRWLCYWLMIDGIERNLPTWPLYAQALVWVVVAFLAEWGYCGKVRNWDGSEVIWPSRARP